MFRIPLPCRDTSLLLSPFGGGLPGFVQTSLLLLLVILPVVLVIWLYRYELRLVRRPVALGLLGLRLLVLLLLVFLAGFQPILARSATEALPGRVLIAVDRSTSMELADPQRSVEEKLGLARALRVAGDLASDAQLEGWIQDGASRGRQRDLVDQVCRRVDALTRAQIAQRVLSSEGVGLQDAVASRHKVELLGFAQDAWDMNSEDAEAAPQASAGLQFTDLRLPLARAQERSGPDQGRILGVVLLTDGQHNWGPSPVPKAVELGGQSLPVYPVALGARQAPPDVALASLRAPSSVFKDAEIPIEARIKVAGLPAQDLVVELRRPDAPPLEERLHHEGGDRYYTVRFQLRLGQVGTQSLTVTVRPTDGESRTDNNSRPITVNVADDKAKVLLVDGEARWEYHYLANALLRDRAVQLQSVVFAQPRLGRLSEEELQKAGNPRLALPSEPDALAAYDCIILGDVTPDQLPLEDRVRLEKYVADRGGTLVIVAGKRAMPQGFPVGPGAAGEPLRKLLPIEDPRPVDPVQGFPIVLTPEGQLASFLQMDSAPDRSAQRWSEFPRHFWGVVGRTKPGAVALAAYAEDGLDGKKAGKGAKDLALLARQNYGFGRVLFVGVDSTWRWRYRTGDTYHHRFWGQAVRWAASDKPLVAGNEYVRFGTREPVYRQGQEAELVVRFDEETPRLSAQAMPEAHVFAQAGRADKPVAVVPLTGREAQPRVLEGRLRDLPPGQYQVALAIPELADKVRDLRAAFTVTPPESDEMIELGTNWPLLEEVAARSGGQVFTPESATQLVDLLVRQSVTHELRSEHRLWQWWVTLVVVLVLLTLEWAGRKWAGLP